MSTRAEIETCQKLVRNQAGEISSNINPEAFYFYFPLFYFVGTLIITITRSSSPWTERGEERSSWSQPWDKRVFPLSEDDLKILEVSKDINI